MPPVPTPPKIPRRHGRVRCQHIECSLGRVLNLSASGLNAACRGRPVYELGEPIVVTIHGLEGPFEVPARVVWIRKIGFRRHEVGVTFLAVSDHARQSLTALGRAAASNETIGPEGLKAAG
jgi:hypothetical protein